MDFTKHLLGGEVPELLDHLQTLGLNSKQAQQFLDNTGEQVSGLMQGADDTLDLSGSGSNLISSLMEKMDIQDLAVRTGIDPNVASRGLERVLPALIDAFQNTEISDLAANGLFGKLKRAMGRFVSGVSH